MKRSSDLRLSGDNFRRNDKTAGMHLLAIAFLIFTAAIILIWSHFQLLWADEFGFGLIGINQTASIGSLFHIELTKPVSFDPMAYNVMLHYIVRLFGTGALAMRLPSMLGFLLMQVCLYFVVRRIATERAAIFAMVLPVLSGSVVYAVQARPYGILLGLSGLVLLCWQTAGRGGARRTLALILLAFSLVFAVNTQYYSVLLFIPLCAAEFTRILERRSLDIPMLMSIIVGMAGILLAVPFAKALSTFRGNHSGQAVNFHFINHCYLWLMVGYVHLSLREQHLTGLYFVCIVVALIVGFVRLRSRVVLMLPPSEIVFLITLAAFPFLGYALANLVTHFIEARYMQPAIIGIAALFAIAAAPLLQNDMLARAVFASLFVLMALTGASHIYAEKDVGDQVRANLLLSPETQRNLAAFAGQPIYVTNHSVFELVEYYSPNPELRSRISLLYLDNKINKLGVGADISAQVANMYADGVPRVIPYELISAPGSQRLIVLNHDPGDRMEEQLESSHAQITTLGPAFWGDLVSVRFPTQ